MAFGERFRDIFFKASDAAKPPEKPVAPNQTKVEQSTADTRQKQEFDFTTGEAAELLSKLGEEGFNAKHVVRCLERNESMISPRKEVLRLSELYWKHQGMPMASVNVGKDFRFRDVFQSIARQVKQDETISFQEPVSEFTNLMGKQKFKMLISVAEDAEKNVNTEDFGNTVRYWMEHEGIKIAAQVSSVERLSDSGLGEIGIASSSYIGK